MKIHIENTTKTVTVNGVPARIWEGMTDGGIPVHCYITRIAVKGRLGPAAYQEFKQQLEECRKPSFEIDAIPLRLIL